MNTPRVRLRPLGPLLSPEQTRELAAMYPDDKRFTLALVFHDAA